MSKKVCWRPESLKRRQYDLRRCAPGGEFPAAAGKGLDGLREKVAERRSRINLTCWKIYMANNS